MREWSCGHAIFHESSKEWLFKSDVGTRQTIGICFEPANYCMICGIPRQTEEKKMSEYHPLTERLRQDKRMLPTTTHLYVIGYVVDSIIREWLEEKAKHIYDNYGHGFARNPDTLREILELLPVERSLADKFREALIVVDENNVHTLADPLYLAKIAEDHYSKEKS